MAAQMIDVGDLSPRPSPVRVPVKAPLSEARQSVDDLIGDALRYRTGPQFRELVDFVAGFRGQAPFNAMLLHVQSPGSTFVATARRWREVYGRVLVPGARPLVVLQTFGPVLFVYDVSDTASLPGAPKLPDAVEQPFATSMVSGVADALALAIGNARWDGVRVSFVRAGSQSAGFVRPAEDGQQIPVPARGAPRDGAVHVPLRYEIEISDRLDCSGRYVTLLHELAHVYCGHLGTPNEKWWPDRRLGAQVAREIEAEAASYITARRLDETVTFPPYLAHHLGDTSDLPGEVSLERILKVAGELERMSRERLSRRDKRSRDAGRGRS